MQVVTGIGTALHPLRGASFRTLWLATSISSLGDAFNNVALLWLVLHLTGSGFDVGLILAARLLPAFILVPVIGTLVDRSSRRSTMIVSDLVRAGLSLGFLAVTSAERVPLTYVLVALMAAATAVFTPARRASVPHLTTDGTLVAGNALLHMAQRVVAIVGAGVGGLAVATIGPDLAFIANALSFLLSAALLLAIPPWEARLAASDAAADGERTAEPSGTGIRAALPLIAQSPLILPILVAIIGWPLGGGAVSILLSVFPARVLGSGAAGIGALYAAYGAGTLLGSLVAPSLTTSPQRSPLDALRWLAIVTGIGYGLDGLFEVGLAASPTIAMAAASMVAVGIALAVSESALVTLQMQAVADSIRGRFFTLSQGIENGVLALSTIGSGWLLLALSPRLVGGLAGVAHVAVGLVMLPLAARSGRRTATAGAWPAPPRMGRGR